MDQTTASGSYHHNRHASPYSEHKLASTAADNAPPSHSVAQLRKVLSVMFPHSYIGLYHQPPHSVCSPFRIKQVAPAASETKVNLVMKNKKKKSAQFEQVLLGVDQERRPANGRYDDDHDNGGQSSLSQSSSTCSSALFNLRLEPSTEPSSRVQVLQLQDQLAESLVGHKAKPVGLCPVRRAIYDQCFDEIIRQVTVGCIEQGLLLFRIRNELRMTVSCYRRLYESAVRFGLNKSFDAKLQQFGQDQDDKLAARQSQDRIETLPANLIDSQAESIARLKEYYENELAKKDEIIGQQRAIMRALNLNLDQQQQEPVIQ